MLKTIDHINVVVKDLEGAVRFFTRLGFVEEDRSSLSGEWISAIVGLKGVEAEYVKLGLNAGGAEAGTDPV